MPRGKNISSYQKSNKDINQKEIKQQEAKVTYFPNIAKPLEYVEDYMSITKLKNKFVDAYSYVKIGARYATKYATIAAKFTKNKVTDLTNSAYKKMESSYRNSGLSKQVKAASMTMKKAGNYIANSIRNKAKETKEIFKNLSDRVSNKFQMWYMNSNLKILVNDTKPYINKLGDWSKKRAKDIAKGFGYAKEIGIISLDFTQRGVKKVGKFVNSCKNFIGERKTVKAIKGFFGMCARKVANVYNKYAQKIINKYNDLRYTPDFEYAKHRYDKQDDVDRHFDPDFDAKMKNFEDKFNKIKEGSKDTFSQIKRNITVRKNYKRLSDQYFENDNGNGLGAIEMQEIGSNKIGNGFVQALDGNNIGKADGRSIPDLYEAGKITEDKMMEAIKNNQINSSDLKELIDRKLIDENLIKLKNTDTKIIDVNKEKELVSFNSLSNEESSKEKGKKTKELTPEQIIKNNIEMSENKDLKEDIKRMDSKNILKFLDDSLKKVNFKLKDFSTITGLPDIHNTALGIFTKEKDQNLLQKLSNESFNMAKDVKIGSQILAVNKYMNKILDGSATITDMYKFYANYKKAEVNITKKLDSKFKSNATKYLGIFDGILDTKDAIERYQKIGKQEKKINDFYNKEISNIENKNKDKLMTKAFGDIKVEINQQIKTQKIGAVLDGINGITDSISNYGALKGLKVVECLFGKYGALKNFGKQLTDYVKKNFFDDRKVYIRDIFGTEENYVKFQKEYKLTADQVDRYILRETKSTSINHLADKIRAEHAMQIASNLHEENTTGAKEISENAKLGKTADEIYKKIGGSGTIKQALTKCTAGMSSDYSKKDSTKNNPAKNELGMGMGF